MNKCKVEIVVQFGAHLPGTSTLLNDVLREYNCENGDVTFYNAVDSFSDKQNYNRPWAGLLHQDATYVEKNFLPIVWKQFGANCNFLYALSSPVVDYLKDKVKVPVSLCHIPVDPNMPQWSIDNFHGMLITAGAHLRNKELVYEALANFPDVTYLGHKKENRCYNDKYEDYLTKSVMVESYQCCSGSTTICECIGHGTPIICNRLPATEEYLGTNYPLFYELDRITDAINTSLYDTSLLIAANEYLKNRRELLSVAKLRDNLNKHMTRKNGLGNMLLL